MKRVRSPNFLFSSRRVFNCAVAVVGADSAGDGVDPQGKRRFAESGRPAIYIEKQE
ncbi:MAG: hypothetical protein C5S48_05765 [Candidatus Methanogaster sp.]|nr:MAG: hypothetical protein C5S48_05765 [ANME-2 cluster archaeon]